MPQFFAAGDASHSTTVDLTERSRYSKFVTMSTEGSDRLVPSSSGQTESDGIGWRRRDQRLLAEDTRDAMFCPGNGRYGR